MQQLEDSLLHLDFGWTVFVYGPMFSGKTEETIRFLRRAKNYAHKTIQVFKPVLDDRYVEGKIMTHDGVSIDAIDVINTADIRKYLSPHTDIYAFSEVQFFDSGIIDLCLELERSNKKVITEGLISDYKREPFLFIDRKRPVSDLLIYARGYFQEACCYSCGHPAIYTMRKVPILGQILVGGKDQYAPACDKCHKIPEQLIPEQLEK